VTAISGTTTLSFSRAISDTFWALDVPQAVLKPARLLILGTEETGIEVFERLRRGRRGRVV